MIKNMPKILAAALTALALAAPTAQADILDEVLDVTVLPGWREADGAHVAGLRIRLSDGWKTYWRAPGDAGIPPHFDWQGSGNISGIRPHWPVPGVFWENGLRSIGYESELVIPLRVRPIDSSAPAQLSGEVIIGVCKDICIPATVRINATLPPVGAPDARLSSAMADRAMTRSEAGVASVSCKVKPIADGLQLTAVIDMPAMPGSEEVVFETSDPAIWASEPEVMRSGRQLRAVADLIPPDAAPFALDRSGLRITVLANGEAVDIRGCGAG